MSVLVTGGAGYIGSHMTLALLDAGEDVVVLDNLSTGFRRAVPADARFVAGDAGDRDLLLRLFLTHRIDAVIHFAGSIVVPESLTDPLRYYGNNTCASRALIAACVEGRVPHFIFSSSAAVYGMPDKNPVAEDARLEPISPYGTSKLMTELMLRDTAVAHDLRYVALRYFNVAGADPAGRAGQIGKPTHLIKVAAQIAAGVRKEKLQVYGADYPTPDGTAIRDYVHVSDLADAHLAALARLRRGSKSETLNIGYGRGYSVREVIDAFKSETGAALPYDIAPRRAGDPAQLIADTASIRTELDWRPRFDDIGFIVRSAIAWEKKLAGEPRV